MEEYKTLGYKQQVQRNRNGTIKSINCLCHWGSIHRDQWESKEVKTLCRHVKALLKKLGENENTRNRIKKD